MGGDVSEFSRKIEIAIVRRPNEVADDWEIASDIYPDFNTKIASRGARISNIRRACYKSKNIIQVRTDLWGVSDSPVEEL